MDRAGIPNARVLPADAGLMPARGHRDCALVRRYSSCKAFCIGFAATFFAVFDVPVFWPILLLYWFVLFFLTMKRQIRHMIKYRYVPFSVGELVGPRCSPACAAYRLTGRLHVLLTSWSKHLLAGSVAFNVAPY